MVTTEQEVPLSEADEDRMERGAATILALIAVNRVLKGALREIANGEGYYGAQAGKYKEIARGALAAVEDEKREWPAEHGQFGVGA